MSDHFNPENPVQQSAYEAHLQAVDMLHPYAGAVVMDRQTIKNRGETPYASFQEEKVRFFDGAVRTMTHAIPKASWFGEEAVSPIPIVAGDALMTGPDGINAHIIDGLAQLGYRVLWLHHQGRHSELPTSIKKVQQLYRFIGKKSVGRSAHHSHALLEDFRYNGDFDVDNVISVGDSRHAMTNEAFVALAGMYDRKVIWSDTIAGCFEHRPKAKELLPIAVSPIKEGAALLRLRKRLKAQAEITGDYNEALTYAGTFDLHPMNLLHEAAWFPALMLGNTGSYANAVPLDHHGARTYMNGDIWSSRGKAWKDKYSIRPGIYYYLRGLPDGGIARHLDLADPAIQDERLQRLRRLQEELRQTGYNTESIDYGYVAEAQHTVPHAA